MAQDETTPAADATTEVETQPQVAPETPEAGQVEDKPEAGTTEKREEFYQTKYQETLQELNRLTGQELQNEPEKKTKEAPAEAFDISTAEGQALLKSDIVDGVTQAFGKSQKEICFEEQWRAEATSSEQHLRAWADANKVPDEVLGKAVDTIRAELGPNARPSVVAKYAMQDVKNNASAKATDTQTAAHTKDAVEKAKQVAAVEQPTGAPVAPAQTEDENPYNKIVQRMQKPRKTAMDKMKGR